MWGLPLIGKGEISWKVILESQNMELKKWLKMDLMSGIDSKGEALQCHSSMVPLCHYPNQILTRGNAS
jgi:hypothetical protein